MGYRALKKVEVPFAQFQEVIDGLSEMSDAGFPFIKGKPTDKPIGVEVYVWQTSTNIHVVGRYLLRAKIQHLILNTEGKDVYESDVKDYYRKFLEHADKDIINDIFDRSLNDTITSSPYYYRNTSYEGKEIEGCVCYDLNKAYLDACQKDMPDASINLGAGLVTENQIGFRYTGKQVNHTDSRTGETTLRDVITMVDEDDFADFRFLKMPSPFTEWAQHTINALNTETDADKKAVIKEGVVCTIGNIQNHNLFLRAAIVGYATKKIQALKDSNTIYCNTDCIVSLKPRDDLPISSKVGDFKIEAEGTFKFIGFNYWWSTGKKAERGNHKTENDIITFDWEDRRLKWLTKQD